MGRALLGKIAPRHAAVLFAVVVVVLAAAAVARTGDGRISAIEANRMVVAGQVTLIDVRSAAEWRRTGIARGARRAAINNRRGMQGFLAEVATLVDGNKDRPVALICAGGVRSARARRFLRSQGFTTVFDVSEGMLGRGEAPGWIARGLPVEPCPAC